MPVLSLAQRRAGRELGSASAVADSKQTLLCTYLSAVLLVGLLLNPLLGWTWADPVAALVIAGVAVREGRDAWRGDPCCATRWAQGADMMPIVAVVLFAVFAAARIRLAQLATTPPHRSTGFRGVSGRVGSRSGSRASVSWSRWRRRSSRRYCSSPVWWRRCLPARAVDSAGRVALAVIGIAATVYAQVDMGDSWRIGVESSRDDNACPQGVFGLVRNPIFTAMLVFGLGIASL